MITSHLEAWALFRLQSTSSLKSGLYGPLCSSGMWNSAHHCTPLRSCRVLHRRARHGGSRPTRRQRKQLMVLDGVPLLVTMTVPFLLDCSPLEVHCRAGGATWNGAGRLGKTKTVESSGSVGVGSQIREPWSSKVTKV